MIDLDTATASDAVGALAAGDVGSEELLDAQLARIDAVNGELNAVVAFDVERARARCREADAATAAGASWGPLHGLPMTIKDSFETEGLVTTSGAPELAAHVPTTDADTVALLKAAGAVVFAKTNLPLYAGDLQTFNDAYGRTNNPWNPERAVGGSSGGAAAALASGMTLLELGSDIGGSIRNPAHYCGVFGHKPTWGVVSDRGHIPGPPGSLASVDLGVTGPMGRSVADLSLGLDVLARHFDGVPGGRLPGSTVGDSPDGLRVGVWLDDPYAPTDGAVLDLLTAAAAALGDAGARLDADTRPVSSMAESDEIYTVLLLAALSAGFPPEVQAAMRDQAAGLAPDDHSHDAATARGAALPHADWIVWDEMRQHVRAGWARWFETHDVLLAPVTQVAAIPHDTDTPFDHRTITVNGADAPYWHQLVWAGLATLPLLPSTVVPVGRTADGLPVGIQVIGPHHGDRTCLAVAAMLEDLVGGFVPPPA